MITCDASSIQADPVLRDEVSSASSVRRSYVLRPTSQGIDVIKVDPQWTWQKEPVLRIAECLTLKENWDSYGGQPPSFNTVLAAIDLIDSIPLLNPPRPDVVPLSSGGIQLEWRRGDRELDVEITPDCTYRYLQFQASRSDTEPEELPLTELSQIKILLSWLSTEP